MSSNPPVAPPPGGQPYPQPSQKSNALKWILIGVGLFFLVGALTIAGLGFFVVHKVKEAGLDPDLIKRNPGLAVAKLAVASNPNLEIVSADEGRQQITIRDKEIGKTMTMSFDEAKKGNFTFKEDGKEAVTVSGSNGTVEMKSAEGTLKIGGNVRVPTWVPDYPGSDPQGAFSSQSKDGEAGTFAYKTKDASGKVVKFYQDQLQSSGMKLTSNITSQNGDAAAGVLVAEDPASKHSITVVVGQDGSGTSVSVTYATNK